jgi:hypothetical protein
MLELVAATAEHHYIFRNPRKRRDLSWMIYSYIVSQLIGRKVYLKSEGPRGNSSTIAFVNSLYLASKVLAYRHPGAPQFLAIWYKLLKMNPVIRWEKFLPTFHIMQCITVTLTGRIGESNREECRRLKLSEKMSVSL